MCPLRGHQMDSSRKAYEDAKQHAKEKEKSFKAAICKAEVREFLPKAVKMRLNQLVRFVSSKIDAESIHVEKVCNYDDFFAGKFPPDKQLFLFDIPFARNEFHIIGNITREKEFGIFAYFQSDRANDLLMSNDALFERILALACAQDAQEEEALRPHQTRVLRLQFVALIKSFLTILCDNFDREFGQGVFVRADCFL